MCRTYPDRSKLIPDSCIFSGNHSQHFPVPIARRTTQRQGASLKIQLTRCLVIVSLFALSICAPAQANVAQSNTTHPASAGNKVSTSDELFETISQLDKQLFDAIDRCDMKAEASFWAADAEFYHDKDGLLVGGPQIVDAIKNNLCGKVKRELVPGTLEVYPLQGYGAVEGIGDSSRESCTPLPHVPGASENEDTGPARARQRRHTAQHTTAGAGKLIVSVMAILQQL